MFRWSQFNPVTFGTILIAGSLAASAQSPLFDGAWQRSGVAPAREVFEFSGTGDRNNPLRRRLAEPFAGDELFVHFRLRYDAASIDTPEGGDGEFFVLWLDQIEGADTATHSSNVPNLGLHVADGQNRFMARFSSNGQQFTKSQLVGDREFRIVGRLWKSRPGADQPFDSLDVWVDPGPEEEFKPHASAIGKSISQVSWLGFSTGRKTEPTDRIQVWEVGLATKWLAALGLPPKPTALPIRNAQPAEVAKLTVDFKTDVFPLLKERCFQCHAGEEPEVGVRLDVWDELLNQVSPRNASQSRLIQLLATDDPDRRMPPAEEAPPLSDREVSLLSTWIDEGVAWDERLLPTPRPQSGHWAFQPIGRPSVPKVDRDDWVRTPVDAFIARRQQQLGIKPVSTASPETLTRRLWLDLVGLPPSAAVGRNDNPSRDDAKILGRIGIPSCSDHDKLVESLLKSPHYGERWGRHWLDVARWAESNGHQHNRDRPHAWRYRDYVVDSFNTDKPFDQFLREQLAGDQLPDGQQQIVATGFLASARYSGNELDKEIQRNDILVDVANTTAKAFLGLTMECAQCHTHKFDPISIRDYYRFQAFFAKGQPQNIVLTTGNQQARSTIEARWRIFDSVHQRLVQSRRKRGFPEPILVIPKNVLSGMSVEERKLFDRLEAQIAKLPQSWAWYSPSTATKRPTVAPHPMRWPLPQDSHLLASQKTYLRLRGDVKSRGPEVKPGWPVVFGRTPDNLEQPRRALADWIASPENPLTARVWVNRIWQWHFGRGLVETSGDFGTQGTEPTHSELLDWLACELIDSGWSTNHIHRLILRSNTYRRSAEFSHANYKLDPGNKTYWRWQPRRLEAEVIRDSILAVAGEFDLTVGGPSVPRSEFAVSRRRSLYLQQKRDNLPHQQMLFDSPSAVTSCARRRVSTVALQPLYLLNSGFMQQMASQFADRAGQGAAVQEAQVARAVRFALAREPHPDEIARARTFLRDASMEEFCLVLLNLNEFVYLD